MFEQKVVKYEMKLLSSLAKVFQDEMPVYQPECLKLSALWERQYLFKRRIQETSLCVND